MKQIFYYIINVYTIAIDTFEVSLLHKSMNFLKKKKKHFLTQTLYIIYSIYLKVNDLISSVSGTLVYGRIARTLLRSSTGLQNKQKHFIQYIVKTTSFFCL